MPPDRAARGDAVAPQRLPRTTLPRRVAPVIELTNVTKTYGPVRALVGRLVRASRTGQRDRRPGTERLGEVDAARHRRDARARHVRVGSITATSGGRAPRCVAALGWVGHESLCYPDLTGRENIELAARLHGQDPRTAFARASQRFDLGAFADRPVRTYSRGQRQRVALARALVHAPRLLLLDEPTTGLDAAARRPVDLRRRRGGATGGIVVVVTHDMGFADAVGSQVIALERGRRVNP